MKNAVELDAFSDVPEKSEAKAALGLSGTVLGFMGRFAYQKNLYFLLDAFSLAAKEDPSLTLVLVGDGDERENLVRYAEEKCGGRVRFFPPTKTPFFAPFALRRPARRGDRGTGGGRSLPVFRSHHARVLVRAAKRFSSALDKKMGGGDAKNSR